MICCVEGCSKPVKPRHRRCSMHVHRLARFGSIDLPPRAPRPPKSPKPRVAPEDSRRGKVLVGEAHYRWSGADVGYQAMHKRVRRLRGSAAKLDCVDCGGKARDWAYDHSDPDELTEVQNGSPLSYSRDPARYVPKCHRCHLAADNDHRRVS